MAFLATNMVKFSQSLRFDLVWHFCNDQTRLGNDLVFLQKYFDFGMRNTELLREVDQIKFFEFTVTVLIHLDVWSQSAQIKSPFDVHVRKVGDIIKAEIADFQISRRDRVQKAAVAEMIVFDSVRKAIKEVTGFEVITKQDFHGSFGTAATGTAKILRQRRWELERSAV